MGRIRSSDQIDAFNACMVVPVMGKETIRLPRLWFFVAAYVLALSVQMLLPAINFNGAAEHRLLIGVPVSLAFFVLIPALFCAGFVGRRFELLALPLLVLPLLILLTDLVRSIPPEFAAGFEEPLFPVGEELRSMLENVLPYHLIVVALGVVAGRRLHVEGSNVDRASLPTASTPFGVVFALSLIAQSLII
jgi:hypothetical protein